MKTSALFHSSLLLFTSAFAFAAFADTIDPVSSRTDDKDPTPYYDYGRAMAHEDGYQMAVEWHNAVGAKLDAAVDEDALAAFVADDAAAAALLAQVKGAYETDPIVATQVAAVSQWTMGEEPCWICFWKPSPAAGRKVWVKALVARAETADDTYVKLFCLDQLRWCGCKCPCVLKRIAAIGEKSGDKHVKEMVCILLRTLK